MTTGLSDAQREAFRLPSMLGPLTAETLIARLGLDARVRTALEVHDVTMAAVVGRCRIAKFVHARHHVWALVRVAGASWPQIGRAFGVDHASVMYGVGRHVVRYGWPS